MLSHEEKILRNKKKKKMLITGILITAAVIALVGIALLILTAVQEFIHERRVEEHQNAVRRSYVYPETDWGKNIFEDSYYMSLDRSVKYSDGYATTVITEENKSQYSAEAQFMYDVVHLINNGDYEAYNDIFSEGYWERVKIEDVRLEFTMQPLYNIKIEIADKAEASTDMELIYMLYKHDGTFRNDLDYNEEATIPVIYRLIMEDGEIKVSHMFTRSASQTNYQ